MPGRTELTDEQLIDCLRNEYNLSIETILFLPLGVDMDTAVYRVTTKDGSNYFVKVRKGNFHEASVTIPSFLSALGIKEVIPPLANHTGQLWARIDPFKVILYPFVEGQAGLDIKMSPQQWLLFGAALRRIHTTEIPTHLRRGIQKDDFSSRWREAVKMHLERAENEVFHSYIKVEAANFLLSKTDEILAIVKRVDQLAQMLLEQHPEFILCHSDLHGWNLLIDRQGQLYIVDWDWLLFAPKERDLMFIGGGHGDSGYAPQEEEAMFYQGYGQTKVNQDAIAYYRYDRMLNDLAEDCNIFFSACHGAEEQMQALDDVKSMFLPYGKLEMAYAADTRFSE